MLVTVGSECRRPCDRLPQVSRRTLTHYLPGERYNVCVLAAGPSFCLVIQRLLLRGTLSSCSVAATQALLKTLHRDNGISSVMEVRRQGLDV